MERISRRKFIENSAKGAVVISTSGIAASCSFLGGNSDEVKVPQRILGKTGIKVSILSFGGGSQFAKNKDGEWEKLMEEAIKNGVNMFDTAPSYSTYKGAGAALGSDERYGVILPKYRDKVIISTKLETRDAGKVREEVEGSLSRLKTNYIDILLIHAIKDSDDVAEIEKGIYKEMVEMKKAGMIKYIGFSSMNSAQRSKDLLDNLDIDVALLAMNATRYGDFAKVALPSAIKQDTGVISMKVMRNIVGKDTTAKELLEYTWGMEGVSTALIAHHGIKPLKENIQLAQKYQGDTLASVNREELEYRLAKYAGPHALCWAQPGYRDGEFKFMA
jgi:predicted aldo/keto reductase-like oxidoreductase